MHEKTTGSALPPAEALAYLGDAVHSLDVRHRLIAAGHLTSAHLNREALTYVTAEAQSKMLTHIEPLLLPDERDVLRRASNLSHPNRPRHAKVAEYRRATGFEAVLGMLYHIGDSERLGLLLAEAFASVNENQNTEAAGSADTEDRQ